MRHRLTTLVLATTLGLTLACSERPDPDDMAEDALERWGIRGVEADYDESSKVIRLTGSVATEDLKQNAEESVRAAVGRTATITNEITVAFVVTALFAAAMLALGAGVARAPVSADLQ